MLGLEPASVKMAHITLQRLERGYGEMDWAPACDVSSPRLASNDIQPVLFLSGKRW